MIFLLLLHHVSVSITTCSSSSPQCCWIQYPCILVLVIHHLSKYPLISYNIQHPCRTCLVSSHIAIPASRKSPLFTPRCLVISWEFASAFIQSHVCQYPPSVHTCDFVSLCFILYLCLFICRSSSLISCTMYVVCHHLYFARQLYMSSANTVASNLYHPYYISNIIPYSIYSLLYACPCYSLRLSPLGTTSLLYVA